MQGLGGSAADFSVDTGFRGGVPVRGAACETRYLTIVLCPTTASVSRREFIMKGIVCARLGRVMTGLFVALVAASARPAAAITVTFDAGSGIQFSYTEAGMTVVPEVSGFYLNLGDNDGNTSPDLMNHPACCSTPYRFTYNGGAVFSVAKFDFVLNSGTHTFSSS